MSRRRTPGAVKLGAWLLGLLLLALTPACHTARVVRTDPTLTSAQLASGRLAVGAVTALGGGEYIGAEDLAEKVTRQFEAARPALKIIPLEETRTAYGTNEHGALMRRVADAGRWSPADFRSFQSVTNLARFILVMDVPRSTSQRVESVYSDYDYGYSSYYGSYYSPASYDVVVGGKRTATLVFFFYDTARDQVVWVATGKATLRALSRQSGFSHFYNPITPPGTPSLVEIANVVARPAARKLPR